MVQIKRAYELPKPEDGYRVLVDRIWPRGVSKKQIQIDDWIKEIAPSTRLRKWFGHDPEKWKQFQLQYKKELERAEPSEKLDRLAELSKEQTLTLVYGARDKEHTHALVLKGLIEKRVSLLAKKRSNGRRVGARKKRQVKVQ